MGIFEWGYIDVMKKFPEEVRACNCFLDIDALKKIAWELGKRDWLTSIDVTSAGIDDRDAVTIVFGADAHWSETSEKVLELAKAGKPMRFLVK
ncbi:MAG TPA: hypothetical protein VM425_20060 [Myxococcota bacterium]|nr:hypothetical protein [Myxococcota bacterium]